jgi:ubiquinone/menaquinone biosynthesis C-methylase UbiE
MGTREFIGKLFLKPIWKAWYGYISKKDAKGHVRFMNYGYVADEKLELLAEDERERYPLQLYHHIASAIPVANQDMLEVGCGRGGGASYIARYLKPKSYKALDLSPKAIQYCQSNYTTPGLSFICGDAQKLPFPDNAFDIVINVESSHCYPDISKFFSEVYRVLRPGGHFLYADFRNQNTIQSLADKIDQTAFEIISRTDITRPVVKALEVDTQRRIDLMKSYFPRIIHKPVGSFAGIKGSKSYERFDSGFNEYFFYVLKKGDSIH